MPGTDKAEDAGRRKLLRAARQVRRHFPAGLPPALFLTDPARIADPLPVIAGLPPGWGVVFRHFGSPERLGDGEAIASLCRQRGLTLLVSADPHLAMRLNASGVHWPARCAHQARRWTQRFSLQTCSAHAPAELRAAARLPVSAIVFSKVFPSESRSAARTVGLTRFRQLRLSSPKPVYALGGIDARSGSAVAGLAGLAAIKGIAEVFGDGVGP